MQSVENTCTCRCRICGYTWTPRIDHPRSCPSCKRHDWLMPRVLLGKALRHE
jgi:predicted Zn-ribbon and HTH transcriptional regulator